MKKSIISHLATFILGAVIFGSVGATLAYSYVASDISYTTSKNSSVQNVEQAINDLYTKAQSCYKTYQVSEVIYFDPVNNTSCDTYVASNSLNQTKTGCLKWYVIKDNGSSIDVLLDHNTTYRQQWYSSNTNVAYASSLVKPKIDLLTSTGSGGSGWNSGLSPRMPSAVDINYAAGGPSTWNINDATSSYYFGSKSTIAYSNQSSAQQTIQRSYHWLFDYLSLCTSTGFSINDSSSGYGYWTTSTVTSTDGTDGSIYYRVWDVDCNGRLSSERKTRTEWGIRPVVTIQKSNL